MSMMNVSKKFGAWGAVCGLVLAGLLLAGCKTGGDDPRFSAVPGLTPAPAVPVTTPAMGTTPPATVPLDSANDPYRFKPNDAISITFMDLPSSGLAQPPIDTTIKEDGTIRLLQNLVFVAAGKTRGELEKEIHDGYVPKFFLALTVRVERQQATRFFYVGGEVRTPNRQVYLDSSMTVLGAIRSSGDFTDFADKKRVRLTRPDGTQLVINCIKAQTNPKLDLEVFPGDSIWVPRRKPWAL